MELTQLEFFVSVVEAGSFSKAALRVYRTQPAVSIAIRRLEEEIGAPLFDRSKDPNIDRRRTASLRLCAAHVGIA